MNISQELRTHFKKKYERDIIKEKLFAVIPKRYLDKFEVIPLTGSLFNIDVEAMGHTHSFEVEIAGYEVKVTSEKEEYQAV